MVLHRSVRRSSPFVIPLLAALLLVAGCSGEPTRPAPVPSPTTAPLVIEKTRLGRLPRHVRLDSIVVAPDGGAYAAVAIEPDGDRVVSSAGADPLHAAGLLIRFVPKSHRVVYWVSEGHDETKTYDLVADGTVHRTKAFLPGPLAFSADGSRWAAAILEPGEPAGKIEAVRILSNGTELGRYADASGPSVSPDGAHVAYLAVGDDGRRTLYVDGVARQTFDPPSAPCAKAAFAEADRPEMPQHNVAHYLGDGRLVVVTRDADGWGIYRDGTRIAAYPTSTFDRPDPECRNEASIAIASIRPAETSGDLFWWERLAGETSVWRVVKNGTPVDTKTCSEPWRRHPPETSPDGAHVVYPCVTLREADVRDVAVVKDGTELGTFLDVWGPALSPNGEHVAFAAADGSPKRPWSVVVDGHARIGGFDAIWRPRVSDDGATIAWQAKRERKERGLFGIDQRVVGSFDDVLWGPEPDGTDRMAWVVRRGRTLTRLSVPLAVADQPDRAVVVTKPAPSPSPRSTAS